MPTRIDFEIAARSLRTAAQQVGDLTLSAARAGAADILRGGSLGAQVPDRIAECTQLAAGCAADLEAAADLCEQRAQLIVDYEAALRAYDDQMWQYQIDRAAHDQAVLTAALAGELYAGLPPAQPVPPVAPPPWADVRRL